MFTYAHISCIYFVVIGHEVYEIRQVATLPSWPHYPSFPYSNYKTILPSNLLKFISTFLYTGVSYTVNVYI